MTKYFSTFISGLDSVVERWLKENNPKVDINKLLDGLVVYETKDNVDVVKRFPIFNNSFIYLKEFTENNLPSFDFEIKRDWFKRYKTFRVIFSNENQISKIDKIKLIKYEEFVVRKTGLTVDRTNPDTEIWIIKRSEDVNLIGLRITQNKNLEKILHKGELRPQLAYFLNYISDPKQADVFLDPFAGHGSIPKARIKYFPTEQVIINDKDQTLFESLRQNFKTARVENFDALNLKNFQDNAIDKIVTDPPWGIFMNEINIEDFYKKMLTGFARIIRLNGTVVVLTSQKDLMSKLLTNHKNFKLIEKLDILVSGKKSSIYKLTKI